MGRDVKIQIEQRCRISQKNKHLEQKFLILSGLWKNRQECRHSGGKEEKQRSFHDRSTWEREVLQKGTYVLSRKELHAMKSTYHEEFLINIVTQLSEHIFNEDQELNLDDHSKVS